jgi:hypothetical protein
MWVLALAWAALSLWLLMRIGLVAYVFALFTGDLFLILPITLQTSAWYFGRGALGFLLILSISLYGFRVSLGGRRLVDISAMGN